MSTATEDHGMSVQVVCGVVWDARCIETDLEMKHGKGSVVAGNKEVVKDVLQVAGIPKFKFT